MSYKSSSYHNTNHLSKCSFNQMYSDLLLTRDSDESVKRKSTLKIIIVRA